MYEMDRLRMSRLRRLGIVPRWVVVPTNQKQTVAEHSFHVCCLALWLADRSAPVYSGNISRERIMMSALFHDEFEAVTGDITSPTKKFLDIPALMEHLPTIGIDEQEFAAIKNIVKVADILESAIFIHEDRCLGNGLNGAITMELNDALQEEWRKFEWSRPAGLKPNAHELLLLAIKTVGVESNLSTEQS